MFQQIVDVTMVENAISIRVFCFLLPNARLLHNLYNGSFLLRAIQEANALKIRLFPF